MIREIVQQNFVGVAITSFLILFILTNNNFDKKINRLFMASAVCVLILIIEEAWELQLSKNDVFTWWRIPLSALGYTLRPMIPLFLIMMLRKSDRRQTIYMCIPLVINAIAVYSALFCKWAFWYTEDNKFVRGPLGFIPFIIAGIYVAMLLASTVYECRKGGFMDALIVTAIVLLALVATMMESVFKFYAIQSAGIGTSITFYYLFLHTNRSNRDPLTGALTRRRFYLDGEKYRSTLTAVISLDLNNLKQLNDNYGHIKGDLALVTMTDTVKKCITKNSALYRTGGDEFMILCYKMSKGKVEELIKNIKSEMEKTEYRCAIGYSMYSPKEGLQHICHFADEAMYENKIQMKKAVETPL